MFHASVPRRAHDRRRALPRPQPGGSGTRDRRGVALLVALVVALLAGPIAGQLATAPVAGADPTPPLVFNLFPGTGPAGGGQTYITGAGFTSATGVTFGGQPAVAWYVTNDQIITAVAPPSLTPPDPELVVDVVVTNDAGPSAPYPSAVYHYWAPPTVTVVSPDPANGPILSSTDGNQRVVLDVTNIGGPYLKRVTVGGVETYGRETPTPGRFEVDTPSYPAGQADLVVETAGGTAAPIPITYVDRPLPRVTAVDPATGPVTGGTTVVLDGSNLTDATEVRFADVPAPSFTVESDTRMTVVTPAVPHFGAQVVDVATTVGHAFADVNFVFLGPPVVVGVSPAHGPTAGGFHTYLWGDELERATGVFFDDQPAVSWSWNAENGLIEAVAPPHAAGVVTVRIDSADGLSREAVAYEYTDSGGPIVDSITPNHGSRDGGNTVSLHGSGLAGATQVSFGTESVLPFTVVSDAQIDVVMPMNPWPQTSPLLVQTPAGTSAETPGNEYTYDAPSTLYGFSGQTSPPAGGVVMSLVGERLAQTTDLRVDGVSVPFTYDVSTGKLTFVSPPHAVGWAVVVVDSDAGPSDPTPSRTNSFLYNTPGVPAIQDFGPTMGYTTGGAQVAIFGTDLDAVTGVLFGGVPAPSFVLGDFFGQPLIQAVTPPHATGPVDVVLRSAAGDSVPLLDQAFEYVPQPPPTIFGVSPDRGPVEGGSGVVITGSDFTGTTSVTFGGVAATSFSVVTDNQIAAVVPPAADQTADSGVAVVVTNASGPSDSSPGRVDYTYRAHLVPAISLLDRTRGSVSGGDAVTIHGEGFSGTTSVRFGEHEASFTVDDDGTLTAISPPVDQPYLYNISITTPRGTSANTPRSWYVYTGKPVVWRVEPASGSVLGGETVVITGDQFLDAWGVAFGFTLAPSMRVIDQHTIVATVPPCAAGTVWVRVGNQEGLSDVTFASLYTYRDQGAPVVSSIAANHGSVVGGETVVLTGSGFTGTSAVRFGTVAATSFTVDSDTRITAVVPARSAPALVNVFVDAPSGTNPGAPASWYRYEA